MFNRIAIGVSPTAVISLSKSKKPKKPKSNRAKFYSQLMKNLGGETGDDLGNAFSNGESEKFRDLMSKLCDKMEEAEERMAGKGNGDE